MCKMRYLEIIVFYLLFNCNKFIEGGYLASYPATAATANLGVGTVGATILQDSYSVPPYAGGGPAPTAVETIGLDGWNYGAPIQPVVEKKIYVHVPPHVTEQYGPPPPPPRKHYKIIFVKAPSQQNQAPIEPPVEEKTLVYVLVKKPEPPTVQEVQNNVKPSKPEVYFINYKTQKESGGHGGQSHHNGGTNGGLVGSNNGLFSGSLGKGTNSISGGNLLDEGLGGFAGLGSAISTALGGGSIHGGNFGESSNSVSAGGGGGGIDNSLSHSSLSSFLPQNSPTLSYLPPSSQSSYLPPNSHK